MVGLSTCYCEKDLFPLRAQNLKFLQYDSPQREAHSPASCHGAWYRFREETLIRHLYLATRQERAGILFVLCFLSKLWKIISVRLYTAKVQFIFKNVNYRKTLWVAGAIQSFKFTPQKHWNHVNIKSRMTGQECHFKWTYHLSKSRFSSKEKVENVLYCFLCCIQRPLRCVGF